MANCGDMALEEVTKVLSCISIARAIENGMVLILNGITAIIIRIKGIELLRRQAWVDDPVGTHGACSILSVKLPVAASLYVEPVRTCAELCYDSPQMFVARLLDVRFAFIPDFDTRVHYSFAGGLLAELLDMLRLRRSE